MSAPYIPDLKDGVLRRRRITKLKRFIRLILFILIRFQSIIVVLQLTEAYQLIYEDVNKHYGISKNI